LINEYVASHAGTLVPWISTNEVCAVVSALVEIGVAAFVNFYVAKIAFVSSVITNTKEVSTVLNFFAFSFIVARRYSVGRIAEVNVSAIKASSFPSWIACALVRAVRIMARCLFVTSMGIINILTFVDFDVAILTRRD